MPFLSLKFAIFLVIILVFLYVLKNERSKQIVLLISSYFFYACWDYHFLILLFLQTVITYLCAKKVSKKKNLYLVLGIISLLLIWGGFKYYNFFTLSFCNLFKIKNANTLNIILPIGISFYTFQALSYLIDIYNEKVKICNDFWKIALYIGFFPQLTSGPIVKAHDFLPQLEKIHNINKMQITEGLQIFMFGLIKKTVIADRIEPCVAAVYSAPKAYSGISLFCTAVFYSIQIYCDFSGYSDMAIGVARMIGYDLGRNFNAPYIAANPTDFWRRWHISLSSWFKEYLYYPLGGNRRGIYRTYLNIFIVMLVSGLWHGANWNYIFWGVLHGIACIIHKIFSCLKKKFQFRIDNNLIAYLSKISSILVNLIFVTISWIFFRVDSFETAWIILSRIVTMAPGVTYIYTYGILYGIIIFICSLYVIIRRNGEADYIVLNMERASSWFFLWLLLFLTLALFYIGNSPFIYTQY